MTDDLWTGDLPPCPECKRGNHDACEDLHWARNEAGVICLVACDCDDVTCVARDLLAEVTG